MGKVILFVVLASLGAGLRYAFSSLNLGFSYGTLLANAVGSFLVGFASSGSFPKLLPFLPQNLFIVAFLGALTTFSSYALDCAKALERGNWFEFSILFLGHNVISIVFCLWALHIFRIPS